MKNYKITEKRFSPELCAIADKYGFKSVSPFKRFLLQCSPNARFVGYVDRGFGGRRVSTNALVLTRELNEFLAYRDN
jgi:hypothetical protein